MGGRGRTVIDKGGSHKDSDWCPSESHGTTKRLAVQRTKETLKDARDI